MRQRLLVLILASTLLALTPIQAGFETAEASPVAASAAVSASASPDPRLVRKFYARKGSEAWKAAKRDSRFNAIGKTPMAQWMSEGWFPIRTVRKQTKRYVQAAAKAHKTPVIAVYAIPARDCGGYSSGGFSPKAYRTWITKMARGLRGSRAMVILEPDALGHLGNCPGQGDRTGLLKFATKKLSKAGAWVYIDAAHTGWVKPSQMAARLARSGIGRARGFSVNVASFVRTDIEKRYAKRILKALRKRGIRNVHYVMDTSRNGGGAKDGNNWCNPLDARLGRKPQVIGRKHLDAYLWVKAPGESDGYCNGGPAAGQWWDDYALRLMGRR
ncbi:glycoside hydrolase family 6 protein [Nocardioides sp.]|uniref:glycoside hydrolase family 6 protein n=1 Tax=Nocardioides sp. TaxID=35761 RepID=UPI0035668D7E